MSDSASFWSGADDIDLESLAGERAGGGSLALRLLKATADRADKRMAALATAPLSELLRILPLYRVLPGCGSDDEFGSAELHEERLKRYDDFLVSIGATDLHAEMLDKRTSQRLACANVFLLTKTPAYGVGLRALGGEHLCQMYLAKTYANLVKNPDIVRRGSSVRWAFWDVHVLGRDVERTRTVRSALKDWGRRDPSVISDIVAGCLKAHEMWEAIWQHVYGDAILEGRAALDADPFLAMFVALSADRSRPSAPHAA